jgi:hypothetical protein
MIYEAADVTSHQAMLEGKLHTHAIELNGGIGVLSLKELRLQVEQGVLEERQVQLSTSKYWTIYPTIFFLLTCHSTDLAQSQPAILENAWL